VSGAERISACSSGSVLASLSPAIRCHSRRHRLLREERAKCHKHGKHACLHHQSPLSCIVCLLPRLTAPLSIIHAAQLAFDPLTTEDSVARQPLQSTGGGRHLFVSYRSVSRYKRLGYITGCQDRQPPCLFV